MGVSDRRIKRYSEAFQRKVVAEIENGTYSMEGARRLYDIGGGATIHRWLLKHGKNHVLSKVVRIEMADEVKKLKQTEQEKAKLERALGQSQLKVMYLEAVIAEYEERERVEAGKKKK
jgi:transposase-like protein